MDHPSSIKTFHARRGRMTSTRTNVMNNVFPRYDLTQLTTPITLKAVKSSDEAIIDFGCGMGDATIHCLKAKPNSVVLSMDVHTPGICRIAEYANSQNFDNLLLHHGDGLDVLRDSLEPKSIDLLLTLFPDPWPKARHHKRRLIQHSYLALAHKVLNSSGKLVIATDDYSYAEHIAEIVENNDLFSRDDVNVEIPSTGFARRGQQLGNQIEVFTLSPN